MHPKGPEEPLVGIVTYAAGIEEDYVGILSFLCRNIPFFDQHACHDLRVVFVHLAAESLYIKAFTHFFLSCP